MDDLLLRRAHQLAGGVNAALRDNAIQGPHMAKMMALLDAFDNASLHANSMSAPPLPVVVFLTHHDDEELRS